MAKRRRKRKQRSLYNKRYTPDEQVVQREIAFAAIKRLYAETLPVWRTCTRGFCRRHKCCTGDVGACLARHWPLLPEPLQEAAYRTVRAGGPRRLPPATHTEQELRRFPATNFVH